MDCLALSNVNWLGSLQHCSSTHRCVDLGFSHFPSFLLHTSNTSTHQHIRGNFEVLLQDIVGASSQTLYLYQYLLLSVTCVRDIAKTHSPKLLDFIACFAQVDPNFSYFSTNTTITTTLTTTPKHYSTIWIPPAFAARSLTLGSSKSSRMKSATIQSSAHRYQDTLMK